MELFEKKISSRQVFDGVVVKLFVDQVELPDGKTAIREVVRHPGAVCVIPVTDDNEVIMVRQFRYAMGEALLEVPAGKLEPNEDPLEAALRELEEESGVVAKRVEHIGELYTTVAIFDERIQMYLATGLTYKNAHPDDGEFLEVEKIPLSTLVNMVMNGEIKDSKTQIAILKADKILRERNAL
ncbi:MAG: NUDIX hydrolase [Clostridia bacterium]|nr:NUDIX hydrolase [Clostridia bacterium]